MNVGKRNAMNLVLFLATACAGSPPPCACPVTPAAAVAAPPAALQPASPGEVAAAPAAAETLAASREPAAPDANYDPPAPTKATGCKSKRGLPDPACTPGKVMAGITLAVICGPASTGERRKVTPADHKAAYTDYGHTVPQPTGAFEVDHLIPLELGGDNGLANLWAQAASPAPGFHEKDHVENYLHKQVCAKAMKLDDAQKIVATDWLSVWKKIESGKGDDGEDE